VSEALGQVFNAPDLKLALKQAKLRRADISFSLDHRTMREVTERVLENGLKEKLVNLTKIVAQERSFANTSKLYEQALQGEERTAQAPDKQGAYAYATAR